MTGWSYQTDVGISYINRIYTQNAFFVLKLHLLRFIYKAYIG